MLEGCILSLSRRSYEIHMEFIKTLLHNEDLKRMMNNEKKNFLPTNFLAALYGFAWLRQQRKKRERID